MAGCISNANTYGSGFLLFVKNGDMYLGAGRLTYCVADVQGYYDRDNAFYLAWDKISRDQVETETWLNEWVIQVPDRASYLAKLGQERLDELAPGTMKAAAVNYGRYD